MDMDMDRRTLLRIGTLVALGAATPAPAWALSPARPSARPRRLLGEAPGDPAHGEAGTLPELHQALGGLHVGRLGRHGALSVLWLYGTETALPLEILTLEEARATGALLITERGHAAVPELVADNRGKRHVLLLAGEILVGGKQNRVLREDILLPPLSGPRSITVYCVEQGRWDEGRRDFESKSTFAQPGLRREVYDRADQRRVWSEVARSARAADVRSPTGSYQEVYETPPVRHHLAEAEVGLDAKAAPGALGAAAFVGSTFAGLDLFRDPDLFARQWRKLLRAHAAEAYSRRGETPAPEGKLRAEVDRLLAAAARVGGIVRSNAGVGRLLEFRIEGWLGIALAHKGGIVHAALL